MVRQVSARNARGAMLPMRRGAGAHARKSGTSVGSAASSLVGWRQPWLGGCFRHAACRGYEREATWMRAEALGVCRWVHGQRCLSRERGCIVWGRANCGMMRPYECALRLPCLGLKPAGHWAAATWGGIQLQIARACLVVVSKAGRCVAEANVVSAQKGKTGTRTLPMTSLLVRNREGAGCSRSSTLTVLGAWRLARFSASTAGCRCARACHASTINLLVLGMQLAAWDCAEQCMPTSSHVGERLV